jgi:hypothetical protein
MPVMSALKNENEHDASSITLVQEYFIFALRKASFAVLNPRLLSLLLFICSNW